MTQYSGGLRESVLGSRVQKMSQWHPSRTADFNLTYQILRKIPPLLTVFFSNNCRLAPYTKFLDFQPIQPPCISKSRIKGLAYMMQTSIETTGSGFPSSLLKFDDMLKGVHLSRVIRKSAHVRGNRSSAICSNVWNTKECPTSSIVLL